MSQRAVQRFRRPPRVMWSAPLFGVIAALVLFAAHAGAQQQITVQVAGLTASDAANAQGVLSVLDSTGRPLPDLTAQEFQAWINNTSVPVTKVSRAVDSSQPIAVVLALDTSGSMQEAGALDQAKNAARSFIAALAPQDTVAIITFADTANVVLPFTKDRAAIESAIASLAAQGTTALYQATVDSLHLAAESANSRRAVVLLSDGGRGVLVGEGTGVREDALSSAESLGVPVFAIGLGPDIDRDYLTPLAQVSGGQFAETPSADGLAQLYQDVGELLRGQYILSLDARGVDLPDGEVATLRVDVQAGETLGSGSREVCLQPVCLALTNLAKNERINDARTVTAQVVSAEAIASVAFLIDGNQVATASSPPYQFTLEPDSLAKGGHKLAAQATTAAGATQTREISLRTGPAGGGISSTILLIPAVAIIIALVAFVALRILRRRRAPPREVDLSSATLKALASTPRMPSERVTTAKLGKGLWAIDDDTPPPPPVREETLGRLSVTAGPLSGQTFPVSNQPVSIGLGTRCLIQLPDEGMDPLDVKPEQARVWIRESHLMVHELRRLTALGPIGGRWEILSPGDAFVVGTSTFKFELLDQPIATQPAKQDPEPAKPPEERVHTLRTIMKPVIPETPMATFSPEAERTWNGEPAAVPPDPAPQPQTAGSSALELAAAPMSEVAPPTSLLAPVPSLASADEGADLEGGNVEHEATPIAVEQTFARPEGAFEATNGERSDSGEQTGAEERWNAPIPFRRPGERPPIAGGPFADADVEIPDILRDRSQQSDQAPAEEPAVDEDAVPNILRDRPPAPEAGPFVDVESATPAPDAVPNILRDSSNEPPAEARADAPDAPEDASQAAANPDVTDPHSWTPL